MFDRGYIGKKVVQGWQVPRPDEIPEDWGVANLLAAQNSHKLLVRFIDTYIQHAFMILLHRFEQFF